MRSGLLTAVIINQLTLRRSVACRSSDIVALYLERVKKGRDAGELVLSGFGMSVWPTVPELLSNADRSKVNMVDASVNRLTVFPEDLTELSNLKVLRLFDNDIKGIPSQVSVLHQLRELDLASNEISVLPSEVGIE